MTDRGRVYVYTGSETGYTSGHWYYYNGSAWTDGGVYNAVAVDTDTTLSISGKAADAKETGDQITELKSGFTQMTTATASDVGKALKAKTVADGKVTEWEFGTGSGGGTEYYTESPSPNLCDSSEWVDSATAPLIPVEYGKIYSANFTGYGFNIFLYDSNKRLLGKQNAYGGVTITTGDYYDSYNKKYTYEITNQNIRYIQFQIAIPQAITNGKTIPMLFDGDVDIPVIPVPYTQLEYTPNEPALGTLKSVMLGNHNVGLTELEESLRAKVKQLGYSDWMVNGSDVYNYDANTSNLNIKGGVIQQKNGVTGRFYETLLFDENVNELSFDFRQGGGGYFATSVVVMDNIDRTGLCLSISYKGIGYLQFLKADGTVQAKDNSYQWTTTLVSMHVIRNSDNYVFTFVDTDNVETVKTYTFAQLGITEKPGRLGLRIATNSQMRNGTVACVNLKISAESSIGSSSASSASRLAGKTWDAWGDSFTDGDSTYVSKVANATGCTATNLGQSGDKVATVLGRFNNRADVCGSYVTVLAGVNDFLYATALETFKTNVQSMITAAINKAPSSKFGWIIPPQTAYQQTNSLDLTLEDYDNAIIEICRANSVPVLDLYHEGGWYINSAFTSIYIGGDGLHPSAQGQALLADKIQLFLERL